MEFLTLQACYSNDRSWDQYGKTKSFKQAFAFDVPRPLDALQPSGLETHAAYALKDCLTLMGFKTVGLYVVKIVLSC